MGNSSEVRDFLISRRSRVAPEDVGLPATSNRRVPGLRRSEAAALAGVSIEYYTRVERGNLQGVSDSVLDAIASALRMGDTERTHLHTLARAANASPTRVKRRVAKPAIAPVITRVVDGMSGVPAFVQNNRFDVLYANPLGRALFSEMFQDETCRGNTVRFVFLSPIARRFYLEWDRVARTAVGSLRVEAGRNPYDTDLSNLIGELSTRSDAFRIMWGANDVGVFGDGTKGISHPVVGDLQLEHSAMVLPGHPGLSMTVYTAAPGSPSDDALKLLSSWAASTLPAATADIDADGGAPQR
jgi:transcriptional regulator with XRE-family HTH domain